MDTLRQQLLELLTGESAHISFESAVKDFPAALRMQRPQGAEHSPWDVLEHMRIAQWDILEFVVNPKHESPEFPAGYWPKSPDGSWEKSVASFRRDLDSLVGLVKDESRDLLAPIAHAGGKTLLREVLLAADHNAYHLGQLVQLRKMLSA